MNTPDHQPHAGAALSVPAPYRAPRPLQQGELEVLISVARVLIPRHGEFPSAADEPDLIPMLAVAANARADAFAELVEGLEHLSSAGRELDLDELRRYSMNQPKQFNIVATVIAGAWLMTTATRDRIGYHGQKADRAGLEDAADELSTGILDPVLAMDDEDPPRWYRG